MEPKVSVIMAAYNCEKTVGESIDSILGQTFSDWELILCDDGSTDETYRILLAYASRFPDKIKVLQNETNQKLPASLNRCLQYATGAYVARMDADDKSAPERLEKQYAFLEAHPEIDVVGTGMTCFDGEKIVGERLPVKEPTMQAIGPGVPFFHATIMMKKQVYDTLGGYSRKKYVLRCEDVDLWIRFFGHGFRGANLQEPLYMVREDLAASKRRTFRNGLNAAKTLFYGFRTYKCPLKQYIYVLKPLISILIPSGIKRFIHRKRWN